MKALFVIFGATGDLAKRKLFPALYQLEKKRELNENFAIVAVARKDYTQKEYILELEKAIVEFGNVAENRSEKQEIWKRFTERITYQVLDFNGEEGYESLSESLKRLDKDWDTHGNRLFYLAVGPDYFGKIAIKINKHHLYEKDRGWKRLMIEKPFGRDLITAKELNKELRKVFEEEEIFRIDHYLVKEMVENLLVLRGGNQLFEPTWNKEHIKEVQIISTEKEGIGRRAAYYDKAGALRDMVQNHLLQMLALTTMDLPDRLTSEGLRREKEKILNSLQPIESNRMKKQMVLGQYEGYTNEEDVEKNSTRETYVAVTAYLNHPRWEGVPFFLITGKGLDKKEAKIVLKYHLPVGECCLDHKEQDLPENRLTVNIQPLEGVVVEFNTKKPGTKDTILPVKMDFCQNCMAGINTPEAYEKLILDALDGDHASFTHWEEVKATWTYMDPLISWAEKNGDQVVIYSKGSEGPKKEEVNNEDSEDN